MTVGMLIPWLPVNGIMIHAPLHSITGFFRLTAEDYGNPQRISLIPNLLILEGCWYRKTKKRTMKIKNFIRWPGKSELYFLSINLFCRGMVEGHHGYWCWSKFSFPGGMVSAPLLCYAWNGSKKVKSPYSWILMRMNWKMSIGNFAQKSLCKLDS